MFLRKTIILVAALFMSAVIVVGQGDDKGELKRLQGELEQINKQIEGNRREQATQLKAIKEIEGRIGVREKNVAEIDRQVRELRDDMGSEGAQLARYRERLLVLREKLGELLRGAYKRSFTSKSLPAVSIVESQRQEVLRRQILDFSELISGQIRSIDSLGRVLGANYERLKRNFSSMEQLQSERKGEVTKLRGERAESAKLQKQLQGEEKLLSRQAETKQKQMQILQERIDAAIRKESGGGSGAKVDVALSASFGENRGRLPHPLRNAKVVDKYGIHEHPTQAGVKVNNRGINIQGAKGASVRVVFSGEVRGVLNMEGMGSSVIVRHGKYLTVYANLSEVSVQQGQKLKTGENIGRLVDNELHFEIWEETKNMNPQVWLQAF